MFLWEGHDLFSALARSQIWKEEEEEEEEYEEDAEEEEEEEDAKRRVGRQDVI